MTRNVKKRHIVVGIGEIVWDILPSVKKLGGASANFVYHANCLGAEGIVVSSVGNDSHGHLLLEQLKDLSLGTDHVYVNAAYPTCTSVVKLDSKGVPSFKIKEKAACDNIAMSPELMDLAKRADAVHFGTLGQRGMTSRKTIMSVLENTKPNALKVFDVNMRQDVISKDLLENSLRMSNVVKINDEELVRLADIMSIDGDEEMLLRKFADEYDLKLIALTKGRKGSRLYSNGSSSIHHGYSIKVADTVGAGDSFTASLIMGILRGMDLNRINYFSNMMAAFVSACDGANPRIPQQLVEFFHSDRIIPHNHTELSNHINSWASSLNQ